jgi:3-oxoacyl-[acyl-carrier-protein] synthase III
VAIEERKADMILDALAKALRKAGIMAEDVQVAIYAEFARRLRTIPGELEQAS